MTKIGDFKDMSLDEIKVKLDKFMTGMIKLLSSLFLLVILSGCMKTTCISHSVWDMKCEKK